MPDEHVGEEAELYALGALDDSARMRIDDHLRVCDDCARRVAEAEAVLAEITPRERPPAQLDRRMRALTTQPFPRRLLAAVCAAAFAVGLVPGAMFAVLANRPGTADNHADAVVALVSSHFAHVAFQPLTPGAPAAKVLYGRGKSWRYFVARTDRALRVDALLGTRHVVVGTLHPAAGGAELFAAQSAARRYVLYDDRTPVATATLP